MAKTVRVVNADGYDSVAMRQVLEVSSQPTHDLPSGVKVAIVQEWIECSGTKPNAWHGYLEAALMPGAATAKPGVVHTVEFAADHAGAVVWKRRERGMDTLGACGLGLGGITGKDGDAKANGDMEANVMADRIECILENGAAAVLIDRWLLVEFEGHEGFIKARHVQLGDGAQESTMAAAPSDVSAPEPVVTAPVLSPGAQSCDICMLEEQSGVTCPGGQHFICASCTADFLNAFCTADWMEQSKAKGRALCPMKDSDEPFADSALVAFVPQHLFDKYLLVRVNVAETKIQERVQKEMQQKIDELKDRLAKAQGSAEQLEIDKKKLEIIETIFTLKCPRCRLAFVDYSGCAALTCQGCGCGFCAYCLKDCDKDAHSHFQSNHGKCPTEKGPIFPADGQWLEHQRKRKERLLAAYLAKLPKEMQGKIVDAIALEAKNVGIKLPGKQGSSAAQALLTLRLSVPRRCRTFLANRASQVCQGGVQLLIPPAAAPVTLWSAAGDANVLLRKKPLEDTGAANHLCSLNNGTQVTLDDEWVEILTKGQLRGWMKTKHCRGRTEPKQLVKIVDANGETSSMLRRKAVQDSSQANALGFIPNNTEVEIVESWAEIKTHHNGWDEMHGFVKARNVPDTDVLLQGSTKECWKAATLVRDLLDFDPCPMPVAASGQGKGKGKHGNMLAQLHPLAPMDKGKGKGKGKHKQ